MSVIGVDVDGVVASFEHGYAPLLTQVSGITFPRLGEAGYPDTWFWERAAGVTKEQEDQVWKDIIIPSDDFWFNLPMHAGAEEFLDYLSQMQYTEHDVYFITSRPGLTSKGQTEEWLSLRGVIDPTVLISSKKGLCCKALNVDFYLDDRNENCDDVLRDSPRTACYMLARPYNSLAAIAVSGNITRINTLEEFINAIEK